MIQWIQNYLSKKKTKKIIYEYINFLSLKDSATLARVLISALSLRKDFLKTSNDLFQISNITKEEMEYRSNFFHELMIVSAASGDNFFSAGAQVWYYTYLAEYGRKYYQLSISSQEIWKRLNSISKSEIAIYLENLKKETEQITTELLKIDMKRALREMSMRNGIPLVIDGFLNIPS